MSIFIRNVPLRRVKQYTTCPYQYDIFSTTFKVNFFMFNCTLFLSGTITRGIDLLRHDNKEIEKRLQKLEEVK